MVSLVAAFENPFKRNRASRNWPEIRLHSLLIRENEFKKIEKKRTTNYNNDDDTTVFVTFVNKLKMLKVIERHQNRVWYAMSVFSMCPISNDECLENTRTILQDERISFSGAFRVTQASDQQRQSYGKISVEHVRYIETIQRKLIQLLFYKRFVVSCNKIMRTKMMIWLQRVACLCTVKR